MPKIFLSVYADSHDTAIEFYCQTLGLFAVAVDKKFTPTVRNVVLKYIGESIPLLLAVVVARENSSTEPVRRVFSLEMFHPNINLARERLAAAGFATDTNPAPLGTTLTTIDPFGNTLYLTDNTYDSYDDED